MLEIGAAVEVAWFIIIFSVDLSVRLFGLLLKLRAMLEMKY
ncbi:hypothetical protein VCHENC02_5628, partial [Vibrio harveyi]